VPVEIAVLDAVVAGAFRVDVRIAQRRKLREASSSLSGGGDIFFASTTAV
jgi:hypothetical protein